MRGKVILRLQNITDLQDRLETCMTGKTPPLPVTPVPPEPLPSLLFQPLDTPQFFPATPGFWPPSVTMADEASLAQSTSRAKRWEWQARPGMTFDLLCV